MKVYRHLFGFPQSFHSLEEKKPQTLMLYYQH